MNKGLAEMSIPGGRRRLAGETPVAHASATGRRWRDRAMKYLCLIYDEERTFGGMSKSEIDALMKEYRAFSDGIRQSGHYIAGHHLAPVRSASTVRVRNGKMSAPAGPFVGRKEHL